MQSGYDFDEERSGRQRANCVDPRAVGRIRNIAKLRSPLMITSETRLMSLVWPSNGGPSTSSPGSPTSNFDNGIKSGAINPNMQQVREGLDHLHNRFAEKFWFCRNCSNSSSSCCLSIARCFSTSILVKARSLRACSSASSRSSPPGPYICSMSPANTRTWLATEGDVATRQAAMKIARNTGQISRRW
jgi:hypothetical protein